MIALALAACSAKYDWREVSPAQAPLKIALPDDPAELTRTINLDGMAVEMQMHGARVDGQMFTAAWARLPATDSAGASVDTRQAARRAVKAMQEAMLSNIQAAGQPTTKARNLVLVTPGGQRVGQVPATYVSAEGQVKGAPIQMRALFAALGSDVFQFVVMGGNWSEEAATTFLDSARVQMTQPVSQP